MNDLNEVVIEGKLVKDPELKWIKQNETAVCKFTVAVNKRYKDKSGGDWKEDTSYFLIETWRGVAISCSKYLKKGRGVRIVGELKQYLWRDTANGDKVRERIYIIAEHVEFQPQKSVKADFQGADNLESSDARSELDKDAASSDVGTELKEQVG